MRPSISSSSVWQTPQTVTRSRTSPGPAAGSSTFSATSGSAVSLSDVIWCSRIALIAQTTLPRAAARPANVFQFHQERIDTALPSHRALREKTMIKHELHGQEGLLTVTVTGPLEAKDFAELAAQVDPYLEKNGTLRG